MRRIALPKELMVLVAMWVILSHPSCAEDPSRQFAIPQGTFSPDGRYGVTVPTLDELDKVNNAKNVLVEAATRRPIAVLEGEVGVLRSTYATGNAAWSPDGGLLYWSVAGKWFEDAQILLKMQDGKMKWQLNLRKAVEEAILKRTKEASPETYAIKKKENAGHGSAYPEGFSVFIELTDEKSLKLPLSIHASLTSDPKASSLPDNPGETSSRFNLESELHGVVDSDGKFKVTQFKLLQKGAAYPAE